MVWGMPFIRMEFIRSINGNYAASEGEWLRQIPHRGISKPEPVYGSDLVFLTPGNISNRRSVEELRKEARKKNFFRGDPGIT